jgi:hypothetical protein
MGWWTVVLAPCVVPGGFAMGSGGMPAVTAGLAALAATLVVVGALQRVEVVASPVSTWSIALRERSRRTAFSGCGTRTRPVTLVRGHQVCRARNSNPQRLFQTRPADLVARARFGVPLSRRAGWSPTSEIR